MHRYLVLFVVYISLIVCRSLCDRIENGPRVIYGHYSKVIEDIIVEAVEVSTICEGRPLVFWQYNIAQIVKLEGNRD